MKRAQSLAMGGWALVGWALSVACEVTVTAPRDQWTVVVSTDAPVLQLGDRLLVDLLDADGAVACTTCRRQFGITPPSSDGASSTFPLSFGVVPEDGAIASVRVRLYRAERVGPDGLPTGLYLEASGHLPEPSGITEVGLRLGMDCFGVPGDELARTTCDPRSGTLVDTPVLEEDGGDPLVVGSWPPAQPVACSAEVAPEMVCIEGGVFLLGGADPLEGLVPEASMPERLVQLGAFAIDRDEVTVGEVKRLFAEGRLSGAPPVARDPNLGSVLGLCTFPADPADTSRDALPVDCLPRELAEATCAALGKRLPTEAEWEFAAGGRTREQALPWGDDDREVCSLAVIATGRTEIELEVSLDLEYEAYECRREAPPGPRAGGVQGDVTPEGVRNMAGNVDEMVADAFAPFTDPCWDTEGLGNQVRCVSSSPAGQLAVRGGSYRDPPVAANVVKRKVWDGAPRAGRGFRCAVSM